MDVPPIIDEIIKTKTPRKLNASEFDSRRQYYWAYQYMLANLYLCPLLQKWGFDFKGKKILDAGCGTGGIACAMMDRGASCDGVDIADLEKPFLGNRPFRFVLGDMADAKILAKLDNDYDLAVLRDVIEHIENKRDFVKNILAALSPGGKIFVTFPPYYSPFGGHTQLLQAKSGMIPFLHLLPRPFFRAYVKKIKAPEYAKEEVLRLNRIRTTVREIEKLFAGLNAKIIRRRFYAIRPTFKIRYGAKPRTAFWGAIPILNEFAVTAAFFYVEKSVG